MKNMEKNTDEFTTRVVGHFILSTPSPSPSISLLPCILFYVFDIDDAAVNAVAIIGVAMHGL